MLVPVVRVGTWGLQPANPTNRPHTRTGNLKAAAEGYTSLVNQFPGYIDCYLRLAALARAAGEAAQAREYADQATQQAGGDVDAQATLATLHLLRG